MTRRVTSSEVSTFRRCRRKWWLTYYQRLTPVRADDHVSVARVGTLVHLGLDVYYSGGSPAAALAAVEARSDDDLAKLAEVSESGVADAGKVKKLDKQRDLAVTMLEGYFDWLEETGADQGLTIVGSEEAVEVPVAGLPGVSLLGKFDTRVLRDQDGAILFIDHKTVQSIEGYTEGAYRAPQFRHYHLLEYLKHLADVEAGVLAPDTELRGTDGVIVNMLRRVGRGPRSKPPFYGRTEVRHNVHVLRAYWAQVMGEIVRMLDAETALSAGADHHEVVPPNATADCSWSCQFRPICPMFDDGSDVHSVIRLAYTETDPLARYAEEDDSEEDSE